MSNTDSYSPPCTKHAAMLKEWAWRHADIVQLVEHWLCTPDVTGSIPVIGFGEYNNSCADTNTSNGKQKLHVICVFRYNICYYSWVFGNFPAVASSLI